MNQRALTISCYIGYFLIGVIGLVYAPALPLMIDNFGITLVAAGAIFPAKSIGSLIGSPLGGRLSDYWGRKPVVLWGCVIQGVGLAMIALCSQWWMVLALFALAGIGGGFVNIPLNALISDINPHRRGAALNTLHALFGLGSLVGPLLVGFVLSLQVSWQAVFCAVAGFWLLYGLLMATQKFPQTQGQSRAGRSRTQQSTVALSDLLRHPVFLLLLSIAFVYNGLAHGLVGWLNTYMDSLDFSVLVGSGLVSLFYLGLTTGRFTCRVYSDSLGYSKVLLLCALGSVIFYPLAVLATSPLLIALGVTLAGFSLSGLYPTGLAYVNTLFPDGAGTTIGVMSVAMSTGATALPWLIGVLAETRGFRFGLGLGAVTALWLLIAALWVRAMEQRAHRPTGVAG